MLSLISFLGFLLIVAVALLVFVYRFYIPQERQIAKDWSLAAGTHLRRAQNLQDALTKECQARENDATEHKRILSVVAEQHKAQLTSLHQRAREEIWTGIYGLFNEFLRREAFRHGGITLPEHPPISEDQS